MQLMKLVSSRDLTMLAPARPAMLSRAVIQGILPVVLDYGDAVGKARAAYTVKGGEPADSGDRCGGMYDSQSIEPVLRYGGDQEVGQIGDIGGDRGFRSNVLF